VACIGVVSPTFTMAVNLSARQLAQPDLVAQVAAALERTGAPPERVCLEITESVLMGETTIEGIDALRALGVSLSIDDFGTGYSSLGYLRRFPVDSVKIDRSFVDGLGTESEDSAIVAAVVSLGHALGLSIVAEGVETSGQLDALLALGCDRAQGYWFSGPREPTEFAALLLRQPWRRGPVARAG
jgi:EAL domain-containing protein (putative c-di-GMP-specific phosphodiesterase class I)